MLLKKIKCCKIFDKSRPQLVTKNKLSFILVGSVGDIIAHNIKGGEGRQLLTLSIHPSPMQNNTETSTINTHKVFSLVK